MILFNGIEQLREAVVGIALALGPTPPFTLHRHGLKRSQRRRQWMVISAEKCETVPVTKKSLITKHIRSSFRGKWGDTGTKTETIGPPQFHCWRETVIWISVRRLCVSRVPTIKPIDCLGTTITAWWWLLRVNPIVSSPSGRLLIRSMCLGGGGTCDQTKEMVIPNEHCPANDEDEK